MRPAGSVVRKLLYFVGRSDAIEEVQAALRHVGYLYVNDAEGIEGIGKTTLLAKLYEDVQRTGLYCPIWLNMTGYALSEKSWGSTADTTASLTRNFEEYRRLLVTLANATQNDHFRGFSEQVEETYRSCMAQLLNQHIDVDLGGVTIKSGDIRPEMLSKVVNSTLTTGEVVVNVNVPEHALEIPEDALRMTITQMRDAITHAFVERMNELGRKIRVVIFVDDFHKVMYQDLGRWFLSDLALQLTNCTIVLTRTETFDSLPDAARDWVVNLPLDNFTREEIEMYLEKRLDPLAPPAELVERIHSFSGGHPQAVALAADLVAAALDNGLDSAHLVDRLQNIPADHAAQISQLVERIVEAVDAEDVRRAIDIGWVVRRFDDELLAYLIGAMDGESSETPTDLDRYRDITRRLEEFSFTERHPPGASLPDYYKFHDFIRQEMSRKQDPSYQAHIHRLAERYYRHQLLEYENTHRDATTYARWFRFESQTWQDLISEWLYHLSHVDDRAVAQLNFALVYFDAFWWWGCYLPFPFCERLLNEWGQRQLSADDREFLRLIRQFHTAYPTGYDKRKKGNWAEVEMALLHLRRSLGLDHEIASLDGDRRHLRAITNIFLSEARRYRFTSDEQAVRYLEEAAYLFEAGEDDWNLIWTLFCRADLYVDRKELDAATVLVRQALELALEQAPFDRDYEVIANLRRTQAEVYWQQGNWQAAFQCFARAVICAYFFHGFPMLEGRPTTPDFYTIAFYREMIDRTVDHLKQLKANHRAEFDSTVSRLRTFFAPYRTLAGLPEDDDRLSTAIQEEDWNELETLLFPPEPLPEELTTESGYVDQVVYLLEEMSAEVEALE